MVREGWLKGGPGGNREARGGEPFVPVSWEKALDLVAGEIRRVKTQFGNEAIFGGSYGWASAGRFHNAKTLLQRFLNLCGGFTGQKHTYSIAAGYSILPFILGSASACMTDISSWDSIAGNTRLVVMFGGMPLKNMQVSSGGQGTHNTAYWLRKTKEAGAGFVNISPLRDDAADFLDADWIAPRPNTDTALMMGLAHTLATENLHDLAFLDKYCTGYERFEPYLMGETDGQPKDAEWAGAISEVAPETIRGLARRMAAARTIIMTNWSLQRGDHGEQPFWMTVTLAAMLGQIGLPGGGFGFGYGSMGGRGEPRHPVPSPAISAGVNPSGSFIPVARISDMLLHPGGRYDFEGEERTYPDIRLVYWCGGNPFHHHQDINRLVRAWKRPETVIVHDAWWTATAKHADIVLPATTTMERNDVGSSSKDRFILAMEKLIEPVGEARNDFDILSRLADRLGVREAFTEGRSEMEWLRHIYETAREKSAEMLVDYPDFDTFWEQGHVEIPPPEKPYVMLEKFRENNRTYALNTPSGKIEIFSRTIEGFGYEDCPPHPAWLEPAEWLGGKEAQNYPLHMLSNQPRTRLHSQMDNGAVSRESKIKGREPVWIHPDDAAARGLREGDVVRLFNDRGAILAGVFVTGQVRPGVVQLPTGAWYDPLEPGRPGTLDKHGNPNVLTMDKGTSRLGQGPSAHSALVEAERFEGELPAITAFEPPPITEA
jgi:biotin/methionine sulfoxide reductase